jgi:hypothetical protein
VILWMTTEIIMSKEKDTEMTIIDAQHRVPDSETLLGKVFHGSCENVACDREVDRREQLTNLQSRRIII